MQNGLCDYMVQVIGYGIEYIHKPDMKSMEVYRISP